MKETYLFRGESSQTANAYGLALEGNASYSAFESGVSDYLRESDAGHVLWERTDSYVTIANLYPHREDLVPYVERYGIAKLNLWELSPHEVELVTGFEKGFGKPLANVKPLQQAIGNGNRPQQY